MIGQKENSDPLEKRRRRLIYRATHRGTFEADMIIGQFAIAFVPTMTIYEIEDFERILELSDTDLMLWLTGFASIPIEINSSLLQRLYRFTQQKHKEQ